ncbi:MAG: glycoside hydrolase family protein [Candidatus Cloacimonetes bacterium]|nr:glycoside hydrolase family protein [Candidatus Cloacimonadota bacterium]MDD2323753.1 glycoside hydrolase family protein [Bacteroidales bacterium]MDD3962509.1 glycoside hydrolase family protein [Bacteroidales bacterium]
MTDALMNRIKVQLVRHEGLRLKPYRCTAGKLTIAIGRNLDDRGISQKEAYAMLERDIQDCEQWLLDEIPEIYNKLDEVRQSVLLNMCISIPQSRFAPLREPCYLGINGLLGFKNTLAFMKAGDWERAANNMLVSHWAKQVGRRAIELSELMRKGH